MNRPTTLKTKLTLIATVLVVMGSQSVSGAATVTEDQIKEKVVAHVQQKLGTMVSKSDQANVSVSITQVPGGPFHFPQAATDKDITITVTSRLGESYTERGIVQVAMQDKQDHHREIGVPIQISVKKPVWVVKNAINAKQPLRASDLSSQLKDISHCYNNAVGGETNISQYIARVNLRPGELLDARKMIIPPDVTYNSSVRILISNGDSMTLTVPGIALAEGKIGDTIRVRQAIFQRKYYSAKIIDRNSVLVEM
ncbi:flagellar basal body P-ring formation chaperone FlgA [Vampirovibrio sp.]|uniref:flagellar basal body P-ring formation chaperone FlgA n=1 Tax=Vampirovibrio sp. TaxID=2717857 RepID=UPI00359457AE